MTLNQIMPMNAQRQGIFLDRYALRRPDGRPLETDMSQMFSRVATAVGRDSSQAAKFRDAMSEFGFLPGGRVLTGAGGRSAATLYNCFVLGINGITNSHGRDSRVAIMHTMSRMVEINARGGGVGINWSVLRPSGAYIHGVDGTSSGPNCWMRGADGLADQIRQGGSRTAALMFMLNDWHPDAPEFARIRERFKRANFSLALSNAFIEKVKSRGLWHTIFPRTSCPEYNREWDGGATVWPYDIDEYDAIPAHDMLSDMSKSAHDIGSPGVVFIDRCQRMSNTWYLNRISCTNPCGEQPLPENGCCNLGAINLPAFWLEKNGDLNWHALEWHIRAAISFLDRVIDVSPVIDPKTEVEQATCRRIGLGVMGLADLLILEGIRYGTRGSLDEIDRIFSMIRDVAYSHSATLAQEIGPAPGYQEKFLEGEFIKTLRQEIRDEIGQYGIRNLALLTQAPTGTTSILAGVSSGIEPILAPRLIRSDATGRHEMNHPLYNQARGDDWVTALDVLPSEHILVQARVQKYIDSSVSKTINLPQDFSPEDIAGIYLGAYDAGCKGITVYREGSGSSVTERCPSCQI
jgi:ribonucleoside-diphosphate reductase alpha chain